MSSIRSVTYNTGNGENTHNVAVRPSAQWDFLPISTYVLIALHITMPVVFLLQWYDAEAGLVHVAAHFRPHPALRLQRER